jgi:Protein of unknown function (DUF2568)
MKAVNLGLAFSLELALLAAIAYWGFQLDATTSVRWLATIGAPAALALAWGQVAAPRAKRRLPRLRRLAFKILVFACGAALLYSRGEHGLAIAFGTLVAVNLGLAVAWNQA